MLPGFFFYKNDNQEIDIEYLTDPNSEANGGKTPVLYFTNQATVSGGLETDTTSPAPSTATTAQHEYRVDWTSEATTFYVDGVLQDTFTTNVPSDPGSWVWNNWR